MEICGAYFKLQTDKDLFDYFQSHYQEFFPNLRDRSSFVRQAANLSQVKTAMWQAVLHSSGQQEDPVQVIDTLPLPVCTYTRSIRDRRFKTLADYGHCAAKKLDRLRLQTRLASLANRHDYALSTAECSCP